MLALSASAFNRGDWQAKRNRIGIEAARMSQEYSGYASRVVDPAENVTIPIETYPNGKVKSSIFAVKAFMFLQENMVWGEDVIVREFDVDGKQVASFRAKNILVNRKLKCGWVPSGAEVEYSGTIVAGRGNYIDFTGKFVSISANARVVSRNLQFKDVMPAIGNGGSNAAGKSSRIASISSDCADYDNLEGVVCFDGNVVVRNAEYELRAERMYVFLEGTNQLKRIVADGSVVMTNGLKNASCAQAVYQRGESKLVMFGDEHSPARLADSGDKNHEIAGAKIVFWTDSEQVEVSDSVITIDASAFRGRDFREKLKAEKE